MAGPKTGRLVRSAGACRTRQSLTHKFSVGGHEGYITVGLFEEVLPASCSSRWPRGGARSVG
ncbi:MAG: hypothetical protein Ct9H300mP1_00380 [Planctomycetaceae bacterium]|nr:MAG: hypothetical protein Ct9H300mP1_00380 [Planctomycetaceae bacterium]